MEGVKLVMGEAQQKRFRSLIPLLIHLTMMGKLIHALIQKVLADGWGELFATIGNCASGN